MKYYDNEFWFPNTDNNNFGEDKFNKMEVMELKDSNVEEEKKLICKLYNEIRAKNFSTSFYLNYKYHEINDSKKKS